MPVHSPLDAVPVAQDRDLQCVDTGHKAGGGLVQRGAPALASVVLHMVLARF